MMNLIDTIVPDDCRALCMGQGCYMLSILVGKDMFLHSPA